MAPSEASIASVRWRPWRIPFRDEFRSSSAGFRVREGIAVELSDEAGMIGIGEASPLPDYAGGSPDAVSAALAAGAELLVGKPPSQALSLPIGRETDAGSLAALRCALETACMDLGSRQASTCAAVWLANVVGIAAPVLADEIPANGTLDAAPPADAAAQASRLVRDGFSTLKLKVGGSASEDIERIQAVRAAVGDGIQLRIDANGGWDIASARRVLSVAAANGVSLCEQPLSPRDPEVLVHTAALRGETSVSIALDESCRSLEEVRAAIEAEAADACVVKPMITGLVEGASMLQAASEAGLVGIVTTSFDTSIGTAAAAHLAALLPRPRPACGLATVSLLAGDLVERPMAVERGVLRLGAGPGLGVTLDEDALETWATGPWSEA